MKSFVLSVVGLVALLILILKFASAIEAMNNTEFVILLVVVAVLILIALVTSAQDKHKDKGN